MNMQTNSQQTEGAVAVSSGDLLDRLSPTQKELVEHMRQHPYPLMRLPGGYWTTTDCQPLQGECLQKWWRTRTVVALQEMRIIVNETAQPFYRGRFKLAV